MIHIYTIKILISQTSFLSLFFFLIISFLFVCGLFPFVHYTYIEQKKEKAETLKSVVLFSSFCVKVYKPYGPTYSFISKYIPSKYIYIENEHLFKTKKEKNIRFKFISCHIVNGHERLIDFDFLFFFQSEKFQIHFQCDFDD